MSDTDIEIPFDESAVCYYCGKIGAFDLMGDDFCAECLAKMFARTDDDELVGYTGEEER
jgi:hypothetical protein